MVMRMGVGVRKMSLADLIDTYVERDRRFLRELVVHTHLVD